MMKASLDCQCRIRRPLSLEDSGSNPSLLASLVSAQLLGRFRRVGMMLLSVLPHHQCSGTWGPGPGHPSRQRSVGTEGRLLRMRTRRVSLPHYGSLTKGENTVLLCAFFFNESLIPPLQPLYIIFVDSSRFKFHSAPHHFLQFNSFPSRSCVSRLNLRPSILSNIPGSSRLNLASA